jgi:hypothetical protein
MRAEPRRASDAGSGILGKVFTTILAEYEAVTFDVHTKGGPATPLHAPLPVQTPMKGVVSKPLPLTVPSKTNCSASLPRLATPCIERGVLVKETAGREVSVNVKPP